MFSSHVVHTGITAREALIATVLQAEALRVGEFEPSHRGTSNFPIVKHQFETDPDALGAVPPVTATSLDPGLPYVIVRKAAKEYDTAKRVEGTVVPGEEVVVREDVASTGTIALEAVEALGAPGAVVEEVIVVDREAGAAERIDEAGGWLTSLLTAGDLLDQAAERGSV